MSDGNELSPQDADAPPQPAEHRDLATFFFFKLGDGLFAFPGDEVLAVNELERPVRVPTAVDPFAGVVYVRGRVLAVVDLPRVLGLPARKPSRAGESLPGRLVVLTSKDRPVAFKADAVLGLRDAERDTVRPIPRPPEATGEDREIAVGQVDDLHGVTTILSAEALYDHLLALRKRSVG